MCRVSPFTHCSVCGTAVVAGSRQMECKWLHPRCLLIIHYSFTFRKYFQTYSGKKGARYWFLNVFLHGLQLYSTAAILFFAYEKEASRREEMQTPFPCAAPLLAAPRAWEKESEPLQFQGNVFWKQGNSYFSSIWSLGETCVFLSLVLVFGPPWLSRWCGASLRSFAGTSWGASCRPLYFASFAERELRRSSHFPSVQSPVRARF